MKKKSLLLTAVATLGLTAATMAQSVPSYVPTNGLVGWWPFNGNANDESGNGNNGTVNGATLTGDRFGNANNAYDFDGVNDDISFSSSNINATFSNYNSITISIWVYGSINALDNIGRNLIGKGYSPDNTTVENPKSYMLYKENASEFSFIVYTNGSNWIRKQVSINNLIYPNVWNHLVFSYNGGINPSALSVFRNGAIITSCCSSINYGNYIGMNFNNEPLILGTRIDLAGNYFKQWQGQLDDIAIWNRALSQQEITALYNAQTCNSTSNTITADGTTTFCAGNYVNLTSDVVGGTYQWKKNGVNISTNGTSRTYKATATGSYTCVATCNGNALTSNAIQVTTKTNASASVTASGATSFCAGDSVTLNCTNLGSNYSVQWYRTNISMENATNFSQVVKQPGTYKVVTKNLTTGCSRISGSNVVVAVNCRLANPDVMAADITESDFAAKGINEEPKGKIYIYPNPTSDNKFTVELMGLEVDGAATLEVYNGMGQILSSEKVNISNGTLNRTIQIDEQSKGQLCLVRLITGSEVYDSKVILK